MSNLLPNAEQQFVDGNGVPLALGTVAFFIPNTSTPKDTFQDEALTILNDNPLTLDPDGRAIIWGSGDYRQVVQDALGNTVWDQVTTGGSAGTTITAGAGIADDSGTFDLEELVNAQTVVSYTILAGDRAKLVTRSNAGAMTDTLPQATGSFGNGFFFDYEVPTASVGSVTLTPTTSTIDGAATLVLSAGHSVRIVSDGTNWQVLRGIASSGVASIADATNGGLNFSAGTGAVTAKVDGNDLAVKVTPTGSDYLLLVDTADSNKTKKTLASGVAVGGPAVHAVVNRATAAFVGTGIASASSTVAGTTAVTINFSTPFSNANYTVLVYDEKGSVTPLPTITSKTTTAIIIDLENTGLFDLVIFGS